MKKMVISMILSLAGLTTSAQSGGPQIIAAESEPLATGRFLYVLAPQPYQVFVDGTLYGTAPTLIVDLPAGTHLLSVQADSLVCRQTLNVDPSNLRVTRFEPSMQSYSGTLIVNTDVPAAEVLVDGAMMGTTPIRIERIKAGAYSLAISSPGHAFVSRSVAVPRDDTMKVEVKLEPGYLLHLDPQPPAEARVELLDAKPGEAKSFRYADLPLLPAGRRSFRVIVNGFEPFDFYADPAGTSNEPVHFSPMPLLGSLRFAGLPPASIISLGGNKITLPTGSDILSVPPGVHSIGVEAPDLLPFYTIAYVEAGQTLDLKLELRHDPAKAKQAIRIGAWSALASGVLISGSSLLLNMDIVAIPATGSYSGYATWKYASLVAAGTGVAVSAGAVLLLLLF